VDFRDIPSIDELRQRPRVRALEARFGAEATVGALRGAAAALRRAIASPTSPRADGDADAAAAIEAGAAAELARVFRASLEPVINATGVIIHTNLGRAPLAESAVARVAEIARGYSSLEYDVGLGRRGRRDVHAESLLRRLTGADAAVVVNNNAAATMLLLAALAQGREVIISRGELVEIGGGFRVPDVMAQSGAILREVGTTNRTRAADYAAAISEQTALILRVHPSNFRVVGFTERPSLAELTALGQRFKVPVAEDLCSGWLGWPLDGARGRPLDGARGWPLDGARGRPDRNDLPPALRDEPIVSESIAAGADVVCFSGDKLLGGPQAGIIAGRGAALETIRRHPLMRALRVDKLTYAALEATLEEHAIGNGPEAVPVQRMLRMTAAEIGARAEALASALAASGWQTRIVDGVSTVGGGSAPGSELPTRLVELASAGHGADQIEQYLRSLDPPVIARIQDDRVVLDLRTVLLEETEILAAVRRPTA
jgi:L-seryl-tRNA(Ser) seleniumtransferase